MHPRARVVCAAPIATVLAGFVAAIFSGATPAAAYFEGPPDGFCSDPPASMNCTECHFSFPVNTGPGELHLTGLPARYAPGTLYPIVVTITQPQRHLWGFELTSIRESNLEQAGTITPVDPLQVQVSEGAGPLRDYVKHRAAGTHSGEDAGVWQLLWIAPNAGSGTSHFYLAGNAANANGGQTLDYIYTIDQTVEELSPSDVPALGSAPLRVWPNPARGQLWFVIPAGGRDAASRDADRVTLNDAGGRVVADWSLRAAGRAHGESIDARRGIRLTLDAALPSGVYWLSLPSSRAAQRVVVVR